MALDRQIRNIQREEAKVKMSLKDAAKKGDRESCLVLAKELVRSRKAINRINVSKAQINSVMLNMEQQLANIRIAGAIQRSTDLMKCMQSLVKVGEISATMQELSREMMRAGIIEEMMEETIDEATGIDEDDMEEAVQAEVEKVLFEVTAGKLLLLFVDTNVLDRCDFNIMLTFFFCLLFSSGAMGKAAEVSKTMPSARESTSKIVEDEMEDEEEITEMQKRLEALRS